MPKLILCDDDQHFLATFVPTLQALVPSAEICCHTTAAAVYQTLADGWLPDLILMDIELTDENGILAAAQLFRTYPQIPVLFLTAYNARYSQQIFLQPLNLCGYVCKPVDPHILKLQLDRALAAPISGQPASLHFDDVDPDGPLCDIRYLETEGHYVLFHTRDAVYRRRGKLDDCVRLFGERFVRIHASYAANMEHIARMDAAMVTLIGAQQLPVSRTYSKAARTTFLRYCSRKL